MERHGELQLTADVKELLLAASSSTLDRLLKTHKRQGLRQPHLARPQAGSLKSQVPVRTWSEWKDVPVGNVQADLVLHCGDSTEGFYLTTLCTIDVATGWTELEAVWGLTQDRVAAAIHEVRRRLPFNLAALHTDNGSEFINHRLVDWCEREGVSFTRGRSYRKNDQAYVEQRNWQTVRREVGYDRFSTKEAQAILMRLYLALRLQLNFFKPMRKLTGKEREGAKLIKYYDEPQTPYRRLLASSIATDESLAELALQFRRINPAELKRRIDALERQLWQQARDDATVIKKVG